MRCGGGDKACSRVIDSISTLTDAELAYHIENCGNYPFTESEVDELIAEFWRRWPRGIQSNNP